MAKVTLRGTITPSTYLPTGEVRTVERTDFIDKLIRNGYVEVVEEAKPARKTSTVDKTGSGVKDG